MAQTTSKFKDKAVIVQKKFGQFVVSEIEAKELAQARDPSYRDHLFNHHHHFQQIQILCCHLNSDHQLDLDSQPTTITTSYHLHLDQDNGIERGGVPLKIGRVVVDELGGKDATRQMTDLSSEHEHRRIVAAGAMPY